MEVISESQRGGQNEQMETGSSMHGVADKLEVKVTFGDRPLLLHLTRNTHVNVNAPVTFENIETAVPSTNIEVNTKAAWYVFMLLIDVRFL